MKNRETVPDKCEKCNGEFGTHLSLDCLDIDEELADLIWQVKRAAEPGKATHRINLLAHIRNHHLH